jgi:hypothetical protein
MGQVARMTTLRGLPPPVSGATFDIAAEGRIKNEVLSWSHDIFGKKCPNARSG